MTDAGPRRRRRGADRRDQPPTMADVARRAGVSAMTVSRVVNADAAVRPAMREKVQSAIDALNYVPNMAAQALAGAEPVRIGLLHNNPSASYLSEVLMGSMAEAENTNVQLFVSRCEADQSGSMMARDLFDGRIDGVIVPSPLCDTAEFLEQLEASGLPAVLVASGRVSVRFNTVGIAERDAAAAMTRHIIGRGHRRIGFIVGNPLQNGSALRREGYVEALAEAGIPADPTLIAQGAFTYRSGFEAAIELLDRPDRPTAIFASNDDMAAAVVAVAHKFGLDVPSDLSVCGFDDTALATTIWPALTTVRQPIAAMSGVAVDILLQQIRADRAGTPTTLKHRLLDFTVIPRESDAPPAAMQTR